MLNRTIITAAMAAIASVSLAGSSDKETAPAFPGAEGFARYTTSGGRGGEIYHVTSLADSGPGTLRDAVSKGNRTIVFDVGGYIDLESNLVIKADSLTIAGQTAPGDGITIRYYTVQFDSNNMIVRFIRFRRSQLKNVNDGADSAWGRRHSNIIIDHCSFSWSIDEVASFYDNANFTLQWCTLGEGLANPGHSKGAHSYGGIWGGKNASFHHNFLCHMQNRTPRFNGARYNYTKNLDSTRYENCIQAERVDFRNCVMFNWGRGGSYGGPGGGQINIINNYYKAGPGTVNKRQVTSVTKASPANSGPNSPFYGYCSRYYIDGNYVSAEEFAPENYDWKGVSYDNGVIKIGKERYILDEKQLYGKDKEYVMDDQGRYCISIKMDEPIDCGVITTHSAEVAYDKVVSYAGNCYARDAVDARYMVETRSGYTTFTGSRSQTPGIVDSVNYLGAETEQNRPEFPYLSTVSRPEGYDSDGDGMPDLWERANGLNPDDPTDGNAYTLDTKKKWYTNLEVYMNSLVETIVRDGNAGAYSVVKEYFPKSKHAKQ